MSRYLATWQKQPSRGPFAGVWRVREVLEDLMLSCREDSLSGASRQEIKALLRNMGNGHPVRFHTAGGTRA